MMTTDNSQLDDELDPVVVHSRREAIVILVLWAVCLAWTVGYSYLTGYHVDGPVSITLGMPTWVFKGVFVPWIAATIVSVVYALWFIADDDLGEHEMPPTDAPDDGAGEGGHA